MPKYSEATQRSGFFPVVTKTVDYTATNDDQVILVDATGTPGTIRTVFLPNPVGRTGKVFTIRKIDTSTNTVRVNVAAGGTIDSLTPSSNRYELRARYEAVTIVSDGTNWHRLDQWSKTNYGFNSLNLQSAKCWVSANYGNDEFSGLQPWEAKRTITSALTLGVNEIILDEGTYTEQVTLTAGATLRGAVKGACIIRAPSNSESAVIMGANTQLHDVQVSGPSPATSYTGTILKVDGNCVIKNVKISNNVLTINSARSSGFWDPVFGGTGMLVEDCENVYVENVSITEVRTGLHVFQTGNGNSVHTFIKGAITDVWQEVLIDAPAGALFFQSWKSFNAQMNADSGYCWDIDCDGSTFINCETSEGAGNRASIIRGEQNTFINCEQAPGTKVYVEGNNNRFIDFYSQNTLFLNGDENTIDGLRKSASGNLFVNGDRNRIRGIMEVGSSSANQTRVTDNGIGTERDYNTRSTGPPPGAYGWYVGDFIRNTAFTTGQPEGWQCTTQALGSPDAQAGTWIEVPSGNAAFKTGKTVLPISATEWVAVGAVS